MKSMLAIALVGVLAVAAPISLAQTPAPATAPAAKATAPAPAAPAANSQQERMKECNTKAAGMKGDEHKQFMSACLSGKEPAKKMTQQEKMTACNKQAGGRKGDGDKECMARALRGYPATISRYRPGALLSTRPRLTRPHRATGWGLVL